MRLAHADGVGVEDAAVPGSVRVVLGRRLGAVAPDTAAVLRVAAVLGPRCRFDHLAAVVGGPTAAAYALDDAAAAGLVRGGGPGRHEFAHPLVRDVVDDGLGLAGQMVEHERVADALAAFAERGGTVDPAVLAVHYGHAAGRAAEAVRYGLAAADAAAAASCIYQMVGDRRDSRRCPPPGQMTAVGAVRNTSGSADRDRPRSS